MPNAQDPDEFEEELDEELDEDDGEEDEELIEEISERIVNPYPELKQLFNETLAGHASLMEKLSYWAESDLGTVNLLVEQGHFEAVRAIIAPAIQRLHNLLGKKSDPAYFAPDVKEDLSHVYEDVSDGGL